jgi:hypothetical protein
VAAMDVAGAAVSAVLGRLGQALRGSDVAASSSSILAAGVGLDLGGGR